MINFEILMFMYLSADSVLLIAETAKNQMEYLTNQSISLGNCRDTSVDEWFCIFISGSRSRTIANFLNESFS